MLLVASIEVLGAEFSAIKPTFADLHKSSELAALFCRHGVSTDFQNELKELLTEPNHIKLAAKFVDVVKSYLSASFLSQPRKLMIARGKVDSVTQNVVVDGWEEHDGPHLMKEEQLEASLRNIYRCRSSFVHGGEEWPLQAKFGAYDLITPIAVDKAGEPKKHRDGSYVLEKPIPTYFWFEGVVNNVLTNVIKSFGDRPSTSSTTA
jgi:hypothetical protein